MANKYVPSGYQILNFGDIQFSTESTVTITDSEIIKKIESFFESRKPLLIYAHIDSNYASGFATSVKWYNGRFTIYLRYGDYLLMVGNNNEENTLQGNVSYFGG